MLISIKVLDGTNKEVILKKEDIVCLLHSAEDGAIEYNTEEDVFPIVEQVWALVKEKKGK